MSTEPQGQSVRPAPASPSVPLPVSSADASSTSVFADMRDMMRSMQVAFDQMKDRVDSMEQKQQPRVPIATVPVSSIEPISSNSAAALHAQAAAALVPPPSLHVPIPPNSARSHNLGLPSVMSPQALQDLLNNLSREDEVSGHHTYNNILAGHSSSSEIAWSSLLEPTQAGTSSRMAETVLAALVESGKSAKSFKTAEDFVAALNAQRRKTNSEGTPQMRIAVDNYYTFMVEMLASYGFQCAQNYHWALAKKITDQSHSLLRDGHFNGQVYTQVMMAHTSSQTAKSTTAAAAAKPPKKKTTTPKPAFPKGSCTKHPESTTHTTDKCRQH